MSRIKIIVCASVIFLFFYFSNRACSMSKSLQQEKEFSSQVSLKYLLFLPEDYDKNDKQRPLIIFLHGAGERGNDLNQLKVHGIAKLVETRKDFPFVVVSPQCPAGGWWVDYADQIKALLEKIKAEYRIDDSRVYLTGLSMGGFGTWYMAARFADDFAAFAPICGGGDVFFANRIKAPVWAFHGAKDDVVPLKRSQEMVDAIKEAGGNVKFTVYPELGHNSWEAAYADEKLYEWFLSHKKQNNE